MAEEELKEQQQAAKPEAPDTPPAVKTTRGEETFALVPKNPLNPVLRTHTERATPSNSPLKQPGLRVPGMG